MTSLRYNEDSSMPKQASRPVTEMFRSWENSMSKYIEKPQNQRTWSENAGQVVAATVSKSLGVIANTNVNSSLKGGNRIEQYHGANNSSGNSELRSYALQPNRIARGKSAKDTKPVSSTLKEGYGKVNGHSDRNIGQTKRKTASNTKAKSDHSGLSYGQSASIKNTKKRKTTIDHCGKNPSEENKRPPKGTILPPVFRHI